jgi:hypothetical protein
MTFSDAILEIITGKRITREEWNDKRIYCLLKDGLLQLHKAGESNETFHPWIINDGDLLGTDWVVLDE